MGKFSADRIEDVIAQYQVLKKQNPHLSDKEIAKLIRRKDGGRGVSKSVLSEIKQKATSITFSRVCKREPVEHVFATSDWHVGDLHFAYETLIDLYKRVPIESDELDCVVAGDLVAGMGIYRKQEQDSIKANAQLDVAVKILQELDGILSDRGVKYRRWFVIKGNHDTSPAGLNLAALVADKALAQGIYIEYCREELVLERHGHGVLFVHGFGSSAFRPQSPKFLIETTKRVASLLRHGYKIDRVCHGHLHWFDMGFEYAEGLVFDSLGGLQANARAVLGFTQRPPGGILYRFTETGIEPSAVIPDRITYLLEIEDKDLEAQNLELYARLLKS